MSGIFVSFFIVSIVFSRVYAEQSSQVCGEHAEMRACGSLCESTCARPEIKKCSPGDATACEKGCRCIDGYVRNEESGQCVLPVHCPMVPSPQECSANENSTLCGHICEPTCKNPRPDIMSCLGKVCTKATQACRCADGYVRNSDTGRCIRIQDCPKVRMNESCSNNEHLDICGRSCEPNCQNPNERRSTSCSATECTKSTEACRCDKGYVRNNKTMLCVRRSECAENCPANEEFGLCGKTCERTCTNQDTARCAAMGCKVSGCQCKQGHYRNEQTNLCVPLKGCPKSPIEKKCAAGEIFANCGRLCEASCRKPILPKMCNRVKCSEKGCRCDFNAGFVYDNKLKKCVLRKDCSYRTPSIQ